MDTSVLQESYWIDAIGAYELTGYSPKKAANYRFLQATVRLLVPLLRKRTNGQVMDLAAN